MNAHPFLLSLATMPILGALWLCVFSWAAALACFYYGFLGVSRQNAILTVGEGEPSSSAARNFPVAYSRLNRALLARDRFLAHIGWALIVFALFLRGVSVLFALSSNRWLHLLFVFSVILMPILTAIGLFRLMSPRFEHDVVVEDGATDEDEESDEAESADSTEQSISVPVASFVHVSPLARALDRLTPRARLLTLSAFDSFILGGSVAALSWWLWRTSDTPAATPFALLFGWISDTTTVLWFVIAAWIVLSYPFLGKARLGLGLSDILSTRFGITDDATQNEALRQAARQRTLKPAWVALLVGSLLFGIANSNLNNRELINIVLLGFAVLCFAAAAAWQISPAQQNAAEPDLAQAPIVKTPISDEFVPIVEATASMQPAMFQAARNFLTLLLPCLATAAGTWHLVYVKSSPLNGASSAIMLPGVEVWWDALLLLCASLRHLSLNLYENLYSSRQLEVLQNSITALQKEVSWRMQQLTTLHSVSADLNNTLSHEQVLNLALQRLMEAVRAEAGAVWLRSDFEQIAAEKTGSSPTANQRNREPRVPKNAHVALQSGHAAAQNNLITASRGAPTKESSTRLDAPKAAPSRLSIIDAFETEQEKSKHLRKPPSPLNRTSSSMKTTETARKVVRSTNVVHGAESSQIGKKRLSAAIENFHTLPDSQAKLPTRPSAKNGASFDAPSFDAQSNLASVTASASPGSEPDGVIASTPTDGKRKTKDALPVMDALETSPENDLLPKNDFAKTDSDASTATSEPDSSGHNLRRSRPLRSAVTSKTSDSSGAASANGLAENGALNTNKNDGSPSTALEGDGIYVNGSIGEWGTFVATSTISAESEAQSQPLFHRVSHTRDTYGTAKTTDTSQSVTNQANTRKTEEALHNSETTLANAPDDVGFRHRNWRLVRATGYSTPVANRALEAMNRALEEGGIVKCARLSASWFGTIGDVHLAPIRWHGETIGVLSVTSRKRHFQPPDRRLLEALANEVSGALRNSYIYQQARRRAERDSVTNLFNHRAMQEKLGQELIHARNMGTEVTVVMMDLNNFKFFNDTYGHPAGDRVLQTVAQCLRASCRTADIIGRYGGDEFIAVLPDTSTSEALDICRRIEECVEEQPFSEDAEEERRIPIGLSFGAAVYPYDGKSPLELLTVADAHLYDAKRGGSPLARMNETEETNELRKLKDVGKGGSFGVLDALVTAIDNKDNYTRRHSEDVTHWAVLMGRQMGFGEDELRAVRISGLLHDVGKIAVPDAILRKPGRLDDEEFAILQQHPVFGALIVKDVPDLPEVLGGIRHHHERFDGKGYPDKLVGEEIPMLGRLLAVPDCFSAMTTNRPYRKSLTWSEAIAEIEKSSGTQFDPQMAVAFLLVMARILTEQNQATSRKIAPADKAEPKKRNSNLEQPTSRESATFSARAS